MRSSARPPPPPTACPRRAAWWWATLSQPCPRPPGGPVAAAPAARPGGRPPEGRLVVGDVFETLPLFTGRVGAGSAALIHIDIGSGDERANRSLALRLSALLEALLQPRGLLLGD